MPPPKQLFQILNTLVAGKNPFGLLAFGTKAHQATFESIRIAGVRPSRSDDWQHVNAFILFSEKITSLSARWEPLRAELSAPESTRFAADSLSSLDAVADTLDAILVVLPAEIKKMLGQLTTALGRTGGHGRRSDVRRPGNGNVPVSQRDVPAAPRVAPRVPWAGGRRTSRSTPR